MKSSRQVVLFLWATSCMVGQVPVSPQDNILRVETNIVLVDTVVTDKKGNYIRDLKEKDFKVWEDNKEQPIRSFSFGADPASPLNSQPRYLILFFDNSTMDLGDQAQARKAAANFIDANAGPNRLMAIANFSGTLQIAQNFTTDTERLKAIAGGAKIPAGPSPNDFGLARAAADFGARNVILGIRTLARSLATVPGRKTLVLLTAGFPVTDDNLSEMAAAIDACNRANVAIYPIDVRGLVGGHASLGERSPFRQVVFQRRNSANDPGTNTSPPASGAKNTRTAAGRMVVPKIPENASSNQQMMYMLAEGTGGFVIANTNDLLGGMQKITKELNEFYLIGYTPPPASEGSVACHSIRVKVDRGGAAVRARTGYCTAKVQDVLAKTRVEKTLESHAAQAGDIVASMQTPYFFTASNVARVNLSMEIPPGSLKFEKEKGTLRSTINVLGIAYSRLDGTVGARFSDAVKIDFETQKQVEQFQQQPYHYEKEFKIVSGEYDLKVVFGAGGESFGKIEQPLLIDAYDVHKFSVSALAWSVQFRKVAESDQGLEAALLDDRTPLIAGGLQLTPAGTTKFKKTDMVGMYFEIYEPGLLDSEVGKGIASSGLAVGVQVRAFDAKGVVKFDTAVLRVGLPDKGGNPSVPFAVAIPAGTLEAGTYKVEVTAMDSLSNKFQRMAIIDLR